MKNGQLVRVLRDCSFTDKKSRTATYINQKDKTFELKKDTLLAARVTQQNKDTVRQCYDDSFKSVKKILPKGKYINLQSLPYDDNHVFIEGCLDYELPTDIFLPIEEKLIGTVLNSEELTEGIFRIETEIDELVNILNKNKDIYPLGITITTDIDKSLGYYDSIEVEVKRIITGYRLETERELLDRKKKEEIAEMNRLESLKKAKAEKEKNERILYEKLSKKYNKETKKTNES